MATGSLSQSVGLLAEAAFVPASSCLPKEGLMMRMGFPPHAMKFTSKSLRSAGRVYEVPPPLQRARLGSIFSDTVSKENANWSGPRIITHFKA